MSLYDPLDRLCGLLDLEQALLPRDRGLARLVHAAGYRLCVRMRPWWSPVRDVPSRSQMRDGWYWDDRDDRAQFRYLPRSRVTPTRVY